MTREQIFYARMELTRIAMQMYPIAQWLVDNEDGLSDNTKHHMCLMLARIGLLSRRSTAIIEDPRREVDWGWMFR